MWRIFAGFYPSFCVEGLTEANVNSKIWDVVSFFEGGVDYHKIANGPLSDLIDAIENADRIYKSMKAKQLR